MTGPLAPARAGMGLCSVTFRALAADDVARRAAAAGLSVVEWGADVHAPVGRPDELARVARMTRDLGLRCCSYGSYFRAGTGTDDDLVAVLSSAVAVGAPRVRVWAGGQGSADASPGQRREVVTSLRSAADLAADNGLELATEFHAGTLADTAASTLGLLAAVDRPNVGTYWQPPVGVPDDLAVEQLAELVPHLRALHVFSWWPGAERRPLAAREELWRRVFRLLNESGHDVDALLEFVPDDDPAALGTEAATLAAVRADP